MTALATTQAAPTTATLATRDHSGADNDLALVALWLRSSATHSEHTLRAYRADATRLLDWISARGFSLHTLTLSALQDWAGELAGATSTKARRVSTAKSLLSFAQKTGYLGFNVGAALKAPKIPNDLAERILPEETVFQLIGAPKNLRDRALMRLFYVSGARVSEAAQLRWKHIHAHGGGMVLTLHGKGGKTRHVPVSGQLVRDLDALRGEAPTDGFVFLSKTGKPLGDRASRNVVQKYSDKLGLDLDVSPHWMRHAHASHALDRGAPPHVVQQTLGHASLTTTSRYAHARPDEGSSRYLGA